MTVLFIAASHVLIEPNKASALLPDAVGAVMNERYKGDRLVWARAYRQVRADWDSYYADLDLAGDEGLDHLWEGMFRTTRALFRLTSTLEPDKRELTRLARTLPGDAARRVNVLHEDVASAFAVLTSPAHMVVYAPVSAAQVEGWLIGGGVREYVERVIGFDTLERFRHDQVYWESAARLLKTELSACIVIDHLDEAIRGARAAGMRTIQVNRNAGDRLDRILKACLSPSP